VFEASELERSRALSGAITELHLGSTWILGQLRKQNVEKDEADNSGGRRRLEMTACNDAEQSEHRRSCSEIDKQVRLNGATSISSDGNLWSLDTGLLRGL
jgi:CRISPR/Cas system CMR subunit Cmr4 (Cas7 group RAMP superfamily)